jgi:hypothetical protein
LFSAIILLLLLPLDDYWAALAKLLSTDTEGISNGVVVRYYLKGMYNGMPLGCCLTALARFGWSNLGLDDIFLGRQSLLQEAASSTLKIKK